ncbi:SDR family oxidoreductase [Oxalobacteraceae bacterium OTU3CAMAD1]|nr:SDR family oxidoreductase [Oxalobacteraceae bacterium OTU3CAMAD1]
MKKNHQGRVAVVTGGASGIGRAFALRLAAEGCDIAIADLRPCAELEGLIADLGGQCLGVVCDLADELAVRAFAAAVLARFGSCDILVNNAAFIPLNPLAQLSLTEFRQVMAINVEAAFLLSQAFAPSMVEGRFGRIVNVISSTTSTPMPGFFSYTTSKMASMGMVRALAAELGGTGVTVNGISPGLTRTESAARELPEALFAAVRERQLIKRTEVPEDMNGALAFLTSHEAGFMTGQVLNVDGGVVF